MAIINLPDGRTKITATVPAGMQSTGPIWIPRNGAGKLGPLEIFRGALAALETAAAFDVYVEAQITGDAQVPPAAVGMVPLEAMITGTPTPLTLDLGLADPPAARAFNEYEAGLVQGGLWIDLRNSDGPWAGDLEIEIVVPPAPSGAPEILSVGTAVGDVQTAIETAAGTGTLESLEAAVAATADGATLAELKTATEAVDAAVDTAAGGQTLATVRTAVLAAGNVDADGDGPHPSVS